ncbi:MAG TPA: TonB-dependent receptor [Povalibacter sp.]|nr:TonB-dependent receptor [Povalibacter sp.]
MSTSISIRGAVRFALISAALVPCLPSHAAETEPPANENITTVIVTGSHIRRTEEETAVPVQVLSREDIDRSGKQNIADVLRTVGADNQGSIPTAFTAGFAAGSAAVSLRGLGVNSTLVLVNGRRMATYGLADDGARTFVDLNSIPFEAVDHVEVLKGGASAIYGSDAVGGVVNIILKDNFQGASLGATGGISSYSDGADYRVTGSYGFGDIVSDRYNVYATVEASRSDSIAQRNRGNLGGDDLRARNFFDNRQGAYAAGFGDFGDGTPGNPNPAFSAVTPTGTVRVPGGTPQDRINLLPCTTEINPGNGVCLFDRINYYQVQPETERLNIFARGAYQFTDAVKGYAELGWFHSYTNAIGTPGGVNDNGVFNPSDPANPLTAPHTTILPADHPDNPTGVDRTLSLLTTMVGGRNAEINSDVARVIVGLEGDMTGSWTYDVAAGYIQSNLYRSQTGFIRWPVLQDALDAGTFRVDGSLNSPELMSQISPTLRDRPESSITFVDATVTGETVELPGGPLTVAVGAEWRKEKTDTPPVPFTDVGEIVGLGFSAFNADRDIYAGYLEVGAPLLPSLNVDAAVRYDHYSDYGHSTTPQITLKWKPIQQLALRGSYSEAFRAPGPTESGNSSSLGFTNIAIITVGDPNVKPETAKSYTAGFVFEPFRNTNISVDYFKIDRRNEITPADQATIVGGLPTTGEPLSSIPGAQPNSFLFYDDEGQLATISGPFSNLAKTSTDGLDVDFRQGFDIGDSGHLDIDLLWTHLFSYKKTTADGTVFEYNGTQGPYALSSAGGTPEDRGSLEATWSRADLSISGRLNYVSGMVMIDHRGEELVDLGDGTFSTTTFEGAYYNVDPDGVVCGVYNPDGSVPHGDCKTPDFITFDLYGKYNMGDRLEFSASILNVTNKHAPFNPYTYGAINYNPSFTQQGAVGTFFSLGAKYSF